MIDSILLCGHTGSMNRGCEAIVRSTTKILETVGCPKVAALTFDRKYDTKLGLDQVVPLFSYYEKTKIQHGVSFLRRKLLGDARWGDLLLYRQVIDTLPKGTMTFNIGGDTYCYGQPHLSYVLNELTEEKGVPNVFWGCSVDDSILSSPDMQADVNRYRRIVVRESLSRHILEKVVTDPTKIIQACDPAFQLPMTETALPDCFLEGNTLGINLSPLVFSDYHHMDEPMWKNIFCLMDWVLSETDMNICLIPHVYDMEKSLEDIHVLMIPYQKYRASGRVGIVNRDLSCTELKYIISRCRFFIGARTHATIAAYSTAVPAIALSYSIKSRGIARDLFGKEEGYALPWKELKDEHTIRDAFTDTLWNHEKDIKGHYDQILPEYKNSILEAAGAVLGNV